MSAAGTNSRKFISAISPLRRANEQLSSVENIFRRIHKNVMNSTKCLVKGESSEGWIELRLIDSCWHWNVPIRMPEAPKSVFKSYRQLKPYEFDQKRNLVR